MPWQPKWDIDLAFGEEGERQVAEMLGLKASKLEVKRDALFHRTGNVYIEVSQDPGARGSYKPSGIHVTEADYWVFVCGEAVTFIPTQVLRDYVAAQSVPPRDGGTTGDNPTKGYTESLRTLLHLAAAQGKHDRR